MRALALALALTVLLGAGAPTGEAKKRAPKKPNIVVLMTDDQDSASMKVMRQTRRLIGKAGVTFENSFATLPLCCPSRSTFLTGQYAHNHGVVWNWEPEGGYNKLDHSNTLPLWLQRAGYHTAQIGKYVNEYGQKTDPHLVPPGWNEWRAMIYPTSYRYYDFAMNVNGALRSYGEPSRDYPFGNGPHNTDVLTTMAARFIKRRARSRKPFFLWMNPNAPHTTFSRYEGSPRYEGAPAVPLPRHAGVFADSPLPRPPNFNEQDVSDKPQLPFTTTFPPLTQAKIDELTAQHRGRWGSLLGIDEAVARMVRTLRRTRQLKNTLFIYTSDNGWMLGQHRMAKYKYVPYEDSIRVPLLMRGPGVRRGGVVTDLTANVDLGSTILEAAGAEPGRPQDGISLLPLARTAPRASEPDPVRPSRHVMIQTFPQPRGEAGALAFYAGIRTERYKYLEWTYGTFDPGTFVDGVTGAYELYDLERDPYELDSRHADPAYAAVREALALELKRFKGCRGTACYVTADPAG
jgi:arylsulfatase A-like enzyme